LSEAETGAKIVFSTESAARQALGNKSCLPGRARSLRLNSSIGLCLARLNPNKAAIEPHFCAGSGNACLAV